MYSGRRRRKPVPRTAQLPLPEGVRANPSKRHRARLNWEMESLAGLLPFPNEVVSGLDKLSILRLTVSYLRTQSFFQVTRKNHCAKKWSTSPSHDEDRSWRCPGRIEPEGQLLLQALNGFVLVVSSEGLIFYSSHTIQDYLGFHQTDVLHQSIFELIHTEDQPEFRRNLHWRLTSTPTPESDQACPGEAASSPSGSSDEPEALPPENSVLLERSFVCRFRCLLDNSSGFRPPSILEIRTKTLTFRTKHKLDFTPVACDAKGKFVLGYTEAELRMRGTGYQFIHVADMLYCAENHIRMMRTGESGLTVFRLLTKENRWCWVQSNAKLIYRNGKPDYIIATQRPLVDEEGGEHLQKRSQHHPFTFATGEALLYQTTHPDAGFPGPFQTQGKISKFKMSSKGKMSQIALPAPKSHSGGMLQQDAAIYVSHAAGAPVLGFSPTEDHSMARLAGDIPDRSSKLISSENEHKESVDLNQGTALLAPLDSLSLDYDENCSNNELLDSLETLGLNAEELELLLLDEGRVRGEKNPVSNPSPNNMATNREILSHVHNSFLNKSETEQVGDPQAFLKPHPLSSSSQESEDNKSQMAHWDPPYLSQEPQPNQFTQMLCFPNSMLYNGVRQEQPGHLSWEPGPSQPVTNERHDQSSCEPWRPLSRKSQDLSIYVSQSPKELQQQWPPSNRSGLPRSLFPPQSLENPCQYKPSHPQLENYLRSQPGGPQPPFQHQLPNHLYVQPQQFHEHGSLESGTFLQPSTIENLLTKNTQNCGSSSQQICGYLQPSHASRIQQATQTRLLSQAENRPGPQPYSRNSQKDSSKSQDRVNQDRLDNMETGRSHGTRAEMVPEQRFLPPGPCPPIPLKFSASVSSETIFPFQHISGDEFQETLAGNISGLTNRPMDSRGDFLLPSGEPTSTIEKQPCLKVFPWSSPSSNDGFSF